MRIAAAVAVSLLVACSADADRVDRQALAPAVETSAAPRGGGLAPGSCAEARFLPLNKPGTVPVVLGTKVGGTFQGGLGTYRIEEASVAVLRPDAVLDAPPGEADPILTRRNQPLREIAIRDVAEGDHSLWLVFDGKDDSGVALPPGRYPVIFRVATQPAGQCIGHGAGWLSHGVLTTLDWRG